MPGTLNAIVTVSSLIFCQNKFSIKIENLIYTIKKLAILQEGTAEVQLLKSFLLKGLVVAGRFR